MQSLADFLQIQAYDDTMLAGFLDILAQFLADSLQGGDCYWLDTNSTDPSWQTMASMPNK